MKTYVIRPICQQDDAAVEGVIRSCLIEYGANHPGTAWADPDLGRFSQIYGTPGKAYWVAQDECGTVVGGVGIGPLPGAEGICELQKMYCLPTVRGSGVAHRLMETALAYARASYRGVYLETLENMTRAQRFYARYGFRRLPGPLVQTGHFACDVCCLLELGDGPAVE